MTKNKRIQRQRTRGWRMPPLAKYVGRPTRWGNPFTGPNALKDYEDMRLGPEWEEWLRGIDLGGAGG